MGVVTDSIADMLTRIRNANAARHGSVSVPASRMKLEIARVLKSEGFIASYDVVQHEKQGQIRIQLRYGPRKEHVLSGLRRVSRPGLRIYANRETIPRVQGGLGVAILSTSRGIMTDKEARRAGIGGEVVAYIW